MDLFGLTVEELEQRLAAAGEPVYRAGQIFDWVYRKLADGWDGMTSLPAPLRAALSADLPFPVLTTQKVLRSSDGTTKFLWSLHDKERVETVFIPMEGHHTLCVSSQAGCRFGCAFCASGIGGLVRGLEAGEIVGQVVGASRAVRPERVSHIVFMGTGEPFDNYDNVLQAIRILNDPKGLNIAIRRITISTSGVVPGIRRLAEEGRQIELSVSLHAPNDALRKQLMPVNIKYPLGQLMPACRDYARKTGRQVTFEYILIKGMTCTPETAEELGGLLRGWLCKINLIPVNPNPEFPFLPPSKGEMVRFRKQLEKAGVHTTMRAARGSDIAAACGQLRHESADDSVGKG